MLAVHVFWGEVLQRSVLVGVSYTLTDSCPYYVAVVQLWADKGMHNWGQVILCQDGLESPYQPEMLESMAVPVYELSVSKKSNCINNCEFVPSVKEDCAMAVNPPKCFPLPTSISSVTEVHCSSWNQWIPGPWYLTSGMLLPFFSIEKKNNSASIAFHLAVISTTQTNYFLALIEQAFRRAHFRVYIVIFQVCFSFFSVLFYSFPLWHSDLVAS